MGYIAILQQLMMPWGGEFTFIPTPSFCLILAPLLVSMFSAGVICLVSVRQGFCLTEHRFILCAWADCHTKMAYAVFRETIIYNPTFNCITVFLYDNVYTMVTVIRLIISQ